MLSDWKVRNNPIQDGGWVRWEVLVVATYGSCDEEFTNFVAEVEEAVVVERQTPRLREVTETNEEDQKKKR